MQRSIALFLSGAIVGTVAGGCALYFALRPPAVGGSELLQKFSFVEALNEAAPATWEVLRDTTEDVMLGRSKRKARQFVARGSISGGRVQAFATEFDAAFKSALPQQTGESRLDDLKVSADDSDPYVLQLPRYRYQDHGHYGLADVWVIAVAGHVLVSASLIE